MNPRYPLIDALIIFAAAGFDIFATPALFLVAYNHVAPAVFGLVKIDYWQSFVLVWAVRLLIGQPMALRAGDRREVDRIIAAIGADRQRGRGQLV